MAGGFYQGEGLVEKGKVDSVLKLDRCTHGGRFPRTIRVAQEVGR